MRRTAIPLVAAIGVLAGCGGGSTGGPEPLRTGIYEYELSESYLRENGISAMQARNENGAHEITLDDGRFIDRWRTDHDVRGSCWGTYTETGSHVTFRFTGGCFGDWSMRYTVDGDAVEWSDVKALPPYDGAEEQRVAEVFNGVPWKRVGDAS